MKSKINFLWLLLSLVLVIVPVLMIVNLVPKIFLSFISGEIDGIGEYLFFGLLFVFPFFLLLAIFLGLLYQTRRVEINDGVLFVRYWFTPWMNYSIQMSFFDSYCISYDNTRYGKAYTAYLCKGNEMWLYVAQQYCGNYEEMVSVLINQYELPRKRFRKRLDAHEPEFLLWRGGCVENDFVFVNEKENG